MTIHELLHDELFDIPVEWEGKYRVDSIGRRVEFISYYQYVIWLLRQYQQKLATVEELLIDGSPGLAILAKPISNIDLVRLQVRELSIGILRVLQAYAKGSPSQAYARLAEALEPPQASNLTTPSLSLSTLGLREHVFYRLRSSETRVTNPQGLFHPPFHLRHHVGPNRFSIAGYPSLYASSIPLLALRELHRPGWTTDLYASRLRVRAESPVPIRLLDLRNHIEGLRAHYATARDSYHGQVMNFLVTWPLVMATSFPTRKQPTRFIEEYILPQLLLEWVYNTRNRNARIQLSGIAFSSARVSLRDPDYAGAYNIVVPAAHPARTGYCTLRIQQFEVSVPVPVQDVLSKNTAETSAAALSHQLMELMATQPYQQLPVETVEER